MTDPPCLLGRLFCLKLREFCCREGWACRTSPSGACLARSVLAAGQGRRELLTPVRFADQEPHCEQGRCWWYCAGAAAATLVLHPPSGTADGGLAGHRAERCI